MSYLATELPDEFRSCFYIGGDWLKSQSPARYALRSPVDEQIWFDFPLASPADMAMAIRSARAAFDEGEWPRLAPRDRAAALRRMADALAARAGLLAHSWTAQSGVSRHFSEHFVHFGPQALRYYADLIEDQTFETVHRLSRMSAHVRKEPAGVAALIIPWNAPVPILAFKLGAALAAGCTTVVKPSPEAPIEALLFAAAAAEAGLPAGTVNVITADRDVSMMLVASPLVDHVSFTGSTAVGKAIGRTCIDRMARFTLELGGKSAAILLDDVDLDQALGVLAPFTMPIAGQACFAQTRILAPKSRAAEIVERYAAMMSAQTLGDPWSYETQMGPLVNAAQRDRVLDYIVRGRTEGATLVTGGRRPAHLDRGFFVEPTVFAGVTPAMTIAREEIFGPVVSVMAYDSVDEAVAIANDSDFGLSGTVFGADPDQAWRVATRIRTGHIGINGFDLEPSVPFGGYKQSGMGREGGVEGLDAFLETKTIYRPFAAAQAEPQLDPAPESAHG